MKKTYLVHNPNSAYPLAIPAHDEYHAAREMLQDQGLRYEIEDGETVEVEAPDGEKFVMVWDESINNFTHKKSEK